MKYMLPMVFVLWCAAGAARAQEAATVAESLTAEHEYAASARETQQWTAHGLYVVSAILGGTGTALSVFGTLEIQRGGGFELVVVGAAINVAHVLTTIVGACLDFGSASRRRKLLHDHAELALTPGPGDAGLGFAVHF